MKRTFYIPRFVAAGLVILSAVAASLSFAAFAVALLETNHMFSALLFLWFFIANIVCMFVFVKGVKNGKRQ